ncbi:MAG: 2,3-bisphosphoglycerate-independent phosphoglycerate mutase [Schleiferiaceae bacterium]
MNRVMLMILDGWGIAKKPEVSAIDKAHTPFMDSLKGNFPFTKMHTSGMNVGLPEGQMGNSEVGHMNLGAGRVVYQELAKLNLAVEKKTLWSNVELVAAMNEAKKDGKTLHIMGLLSDGGVHSHINHLKGLLSMAHDHELQNVKVHAFTDGRDTDPKGGVSYVEDLENHMAETTGEIATIVGRYFAMDRDRRWERVAKAYNLLVHGEGEKVDSATEGLKAQYDKKVTDEFIEPMVVAGGEIKDGDVVICFNFRTDRGRQITQALTQENFPEQGMKTLDLYYLTMTNYDESFKGVHVAYNKENINMTLGEVLEKAGKKQIRIAETEKYPHVTFFFSGGREVPFEGESRILCPSPKVATYDLQPEMSAGDIKTKIIPELEGQTADFICLNFANPDMVGHTGDMNAAIKACETVDACAGDVVKAGLENGYQFIILADHGNADCMINEDGSPNTAHTTVPVPCYLVGGSENIIGLKEGKLGDIAPTVLNLMGIEVPEEMTGNNLLLTKA